MAVKASSLNSAHEGVRAEPHHKRVRFCTDDHQVTNETNAMIVTNSTHGLIAPRDPPPPRLHISSPQILRWYTNFDHRQRRRNAAHGHTTYGVTRPHGPVQRRWKWGRPAARACAFPRFRRNWPIGSSVGPPVPGLVPPSCGRRRARLMPTVEELARHRIACRDGRVRWICLHRIPGLRPSAQNLRLAR